MPIAAGVYRHYKGGYYRVLGVGQHTETGELMVVYIPLTTEHRPGLRMGIRPLTGPEGFMTPVAGCDVPTKRFEFIGEELPSPLPSVASCNAIHVTRGPCVLLYGHEGNHIWRQR